MPKSRRVIAAAISDTHSNHKLGLLNPETVLFQEDPSTKKLVPWKPKLLPTQDWLWECFQEDRAKVDALAGSDEIVLIHDGDMCQGANGNGRELVSSRLSDQFAMARDTLMPWFKMPQVRRGVFLKGTGYHEMGEGSAAMTVGEMLSAKTGKPIEVPYHATAEIAGLRFDLAHHGPPPGIRNWLRGNVLRLYTQSLMDDALKEGEAPPDVVLRGHYHQLASETVTRRARGRRWETLAVILPSYCGIDDYARKVAKSPDHLTVGLVAFEIIDGRLVEMHEFVRKVDYRTRMVLT